MVAVEGGVCCIAKGCFVIDRQELVAPGKADVLCVDLFSTTKATYKRFITVYRPPNSSKNDDEALIDLLRHLLSTHLDVVLVGDFNLKINWESQQPSSTASIAFLEFFLE